MLISNKSYQSRVKKGIERDSVRGNGKAGEETRERERERSDMTSMGECCNVDIR